MITTLAQWLVVLFGLWLVVASIVMLARPQVALRLVGQAASTNLINYLEIGLRMLAGMALVGYAELSRFPEVLRISGWFVVVTSAMLFFVPRRWHARYAVWWSQKLTAPYVRVASPVPLAVGVLLIYAVV